MSEKRTGPAIVAATDTFEGRVQMEAGIALAEDILALIVKHALVHGKDPAIQSMVSLALTYAIKRLEFEPVILGGLIASLLVLHNDQSGVRLPIERIARMVDELQQRRGEG